MVIERDVRHLYHVVSLCMALRETVRVDNAVLLLDAAISIRVKGLWTCSLASVTQCVLCQLQGACHLSAANTMRLSIQSLDQDNLLVDPKSLVVEDGLLICCQRVGLGTHVSEV